MPAPPWHYVGDFLVIEFWCDPDAVAAALPAGLEPFADDPGRAAALFVDWQSCVTDRNELVDPARSQYKEFFLILNATLDGEHVTTCPAIWVDRDFALVRGWIQGFPKKLGSVWMTRTFGLDCLADPGVRPGATFGGTLAANDRRLAEGTVTLERVSDAGPTHNDPRLVNVRHFPELAAGRHATPAVHELVGARSTNRAISPIWEGIVDARAVRRAERGARRARAGADGQGLPVHVRVHGRRPRDDAGPALDERRSPRHGRRQRHRRGDRAAGSPAPAGAWR